MTVRTDFDVDFEQDPRLIELTSNSNIVSAQDSHDTLATIQDTPEGGQFPFIVDTTGKDPLGGGVVVGLTTALKNAQYAFQATSPIQTGTVTTPGTTQLIDSAALFQTNLVKRGDWVINFTDQSVTEVLAVVSETELTTRGLRNGTGNTFDTSDAYKVWEVREAQLSGGNFSAADEFDVEINPAFPVFGRTFRIAAASLNTGTVEANTEVDVTKIHGSAIAARMLEEGTRGNVFWTIGVGSSSTSLVTSSVTPTPDVAIPNQNVGRQLTFREDTITVALRGQATDVTAATASATPVYTVTALTAAPVNGDTFVIT